VAEHRALSADPLVLAVESATSRASVAVLRGEAVLAERVGEPGRHHSETLLPAVDAVLARAGVSLDDVAACAISIGPGSFTSLRVGLATVKGLCFGTDRLAVAVPTLEALALAGLRAGVAAGGEVLVPMLDAQRGEVYAAAYRAGGGDDVRLDARLAPGVLTAADLAAALGEGGVLVGEGAGVVAADLLRIAPGRFDVRSGAGVVPDAVAVGLLGVAALRAGQGVDPASIVPRYVRRAEAEVARTAERFE
jgi:tRNA threonylcarbamoyladenosine biosynthesis protein TsaB